MTPRADRIRWLAVGALLAITAVRVLCEHARIPWWDTNPLISPIPETRITPWMSLALDVGVLVAAAFLICAESVRTRRIAPLAWVAALVGTVGVILHGFVLTPYGASAEVLTDLRALSIGATWASAVTSACALWIACSDARVRAACAGVLLGAPILLAAVGVEQVVVEHAATVRMFEADPDGSLAAAGLTPGTPQAAAFERRLRQAEATGAFGLSNVYGTLVAAGAAFWGVLALGAHRAKWGRGAAIAAACALACLIGLGLCKSKGAAGAALGALALVGLIALLARRWRLASRDARALGVLAIAGPLGAVALRGAIGTRIGELSLLFRWHYAQGAARIIGWYPEFGVGPGNFKPAYLLAKNPLNPEQVESPHSVLLDWGSTLGAFAIPWVILACAAACAIGLAVLRAARADASPGAPESPRTGGRLVPLLSPLLGGAVCVVLMRDILAPPTALALTIGLIAWVGAALWLFRSAERLLAWVPFACAAAGFTALAHGQIEVTPIMPGSAMWWAGAIAIAIPRTPRPVPARRWLAISGAIVASVALAASAACFSIGAARLFTWERLLEDAWALVQQGSAADAASTLSRAFFEAPSFLDVGETAAQVGALGHGQAGNLPRTLVDLFPNRPESWIALANARQRENGVSSSSIAALEQAARLDPWSATLPVRIADAYARTEGFEEARPWARRALENDDWLRLDRVVRLDRATRDRMALLAGMGPVPNP